MPLALFGLGLVALILWEKKAHAGTMPGQIPTAWSPTNMGELAPGAAQYLPPIAAPDVVRVMYANAMASGNPMQMVAVAPQLVAMGFPELAHSLSMAYQQLTNNPIPGVAGVGAFGFMPHCAPHMMHPPLPMAATRPGMPTLDPHTIRTLAGMARARRVKQTADIHRALLQRSAARHLQNS